jgi:hypothetical protein
MKNIFLLFASLHIFCLYGFNTVVASEKIELKAGNALLTIDGKNNLKIVYNNEVIQINTPLNNLWKVDLKNEANGKESSFIACDNVKISQSNDVISLSVNKLTNNAVDMPVMAEFTISVKDDAFCFSGSIAIESDEWTINKLDYPCLDAIGFKNAKAGVYWPIGLGQHFSDPSEFKSRSTRYPSGGTMAMPWFSLNTQNVGLYVGSHDPLQNTKVFSLEYDKATDKFSAHISAEVFDSKYSIPDIIIRPYPGKWYAAAKFFRSWYDQHFKIGIPPEWVKDDSGWFLAILKQQNMEIMWPYKEIDKLCDIAERFNLTTIGLFGWGFGGHDHLYPYYTPDNTMGGREELEKAIERAHKRGIRIIIYANGKIMDTSTDFYAYNGYETMVVQKNLQPQIQYYIKQKNSTPVIFAQACTGSDVWRRTMYDLSRQAATIGADGILYDQLGIMGAHLCFAEHHDHKPGLTDSDNRLQMANEARSEARKINPEFIVMTEGTNDKIIQGIDFHHGCGVGFAPGPNAFPELFRYTFPELITTQRNPNPMITRTDANFAAIYGMRHEIESRYPGDVEYLLNGTLPTREKNYKNVVSPPSMEKMNSDPADIAAKYVHSLIEFEMQNAVFFRRGNFIDEEGIDVKGDDILAKGFVNGSKLGVVVWNQHLTESKDFSISVAGYELESAKEPAKKDVNASSPLNPNSLRLLVYVKK